MRGRPLLCIALKMKGTVEAIQALSRVPGVSARFLDIPAWSGGFVPFARVANAKYMVVDGARAWIGTSSPSSTTRLPTYGTRPSRPVSGHSSRT